MGQLSDDIESLIASVTHDQIPIFCEKNKIPIPEFLDGSKREKAQQITAPLSDKQLALIAVRIGQASNNILLEERGRKLLESDEPIIYELTRRDVAEIFEESGGLQGAASIAELVSRLWEIESNIEVLLGSSGHSLKDKIVQHMEKNDDWSVGMLFTKIDVYAWSNDRFLKLIESGVHPLARRGDEQMKLVDALNVPLARDGYRLEISKYESNHSVYTAVPLVKGISGKAKNLIFASNGKKPVLGFSDAINNDITVLEHEGNCLIYDRPISREGLLWSELIDWWKSKNPDLTDPDLRKGLGQRLQSSLSSEGERSMLEKYFKIFHPVLKEDLPALIPQVYLHYDPAIVKNLRHRGTFPRQRMDYLMLLPHNVRVVIEIDGKQHFSMNDTPSLTLYAEMVSADRDLKLHGYEVYRFGANEVVGKNSAQIIEDFFRLLFLKHTVI